VIGPLGCIDVVGFIGVKGLYRAASSERFLWSLLLAGDGVATLGATDGGAAHDSINDEKTPLLARLMRDSRQDRSDAVCGRNDNDMSLLVMLMLSRDLWLD
jgi:hypothetical protein